MKTMRRLGSVYKVAEMEVALAQASVIAARGKLVVVPYSETVSVAKVSCRLAKRFCGLVKVKKVMVDVLCE